jgi:hypothetical protein
MRANLGAVSRVSCVRQQSFRYRIDRQTVTVTGTKPSHQRSPRGRLLEPMAAGADGPNCVRFGSNCTAVGSNVSSEVDLLHYRPADEFTHAGSSKNEVSVIATTATAAIAPLNEVITQQGLLYTFVYQFLTRRLRRKTVATTIRL